jgi:hypothetical protein
VPQIVIPKDTQRAELTLPLISSGSIFLLSVEVNKRSRHRILLHSHILTGPLFGHLPRISAQTPQAELSLCKGWVDLVKATDDLRNYITGIHKAIELDSRVYWLPILTRKVVFAG